MFDQERALETVWIKSYLYSPNTSKQPLSVAASNPEAEEEAIKVNVNASASIKTMKCFCCGHAKHS